MTNKGLGLLILSILPEQEYKIDENKLRSGLEHLGELTSDPKEEVFHDPLDQDGTNRTGIFLVRITPNEDDKRLYLNVYGLMICMQVKE